MATGKELAKNVFISYTNRGDKDHAQRLCDMIEALGVGCWIAPRDILEGREWADSIPEAISQCKVMALLLSDASMGSEEIRKEMNLANNRKIPILPIRIENIPLRDAFEYHLGTRQWVDAYEGDFEIRFQAAVSSILKMPGVAGVANTVAGDLVAETTGLAGRAQKLERELNRKYQDKFISVNAFLSFSPMNENQFSLKFPVRVGSTGVDIWLRFDGLSRPVWFYADLQAMDDPFKWPFIGFCRSHFSENFKNHMSDYSGSRRWQALTFIDLKLPVNEFLPFSKNQSFDIYECHVRQFVDQVLPALVDWMAYGRMVQSQLVLLKEKIRSIFPVEEGWCIESPQGSRLEDFYKNSCLNIYRAVWAPKDNYLKRGYLSFRVQADESYLGAVKVGIFKTEASLETGEHTLAVTGLCNKLLGPATFSSDWWVWCQWLDAPWRNSGIAKGENCWKDNPDGIILSILQKLEQLRSVIPLLDLAHQDIPALQIRSIDAFPDTKWSPLFVRSWLNYISNGLNEQFQELNSALGIHWDYQYRVAQHWIPPSIQGQIKVGNFDFAVIFAFDQKTMLIELKSIDQPHFEMDVIRNYLAARLPGFLMENRNTLLIKKIVVDVDCGGGTVSDWMHRFMAFTIDKLSELANVLRMIHGHLLSTMSLVNSVKTEIADVFLVAEGWCIRDEASSLDQIDGGFLFWNKNWLPSNSDCSLNDMPPLVIKLASYAQLFDGIYLSVRRTEAFSDDSAAFELGSILGACQIVFGKGGADDEYLWWSNLSDGFDVTGANAFDKRALIEGDERAAFLAHVLARLLEFKRIAHLFKAANLKILAGKSGVPSLLSP